MTEPWTGSIKSDGVLRRTTYGSHLCELCMCSFSSTIMLRVHLIKCTEENEPIPCEVCNALVAKKVYSTHVSVCSRIVNQQKAAMRRPPPRAPSPEPELEPEEPEPTVPDNIVLNLVKFRSLETLMAVDHHHASAVIYDNHEENALQLEHEAKNARASFRTHVSQQAAQKLASLPAPVTTTSS